MNQWHRLIGYLKDGRLAPDNNAAINSIHPFVTRVLSTLKCQDIAPDFSCPYGALSCAA
ncbi:MAG: hypothetical protein CSA26_00880 [Desulfobacterales bacterium]|nr:MAG: hypothetical protein CSA26_00880 [Desulfobacterales bacterium]